MNETSFTSTPAMRERLAGMHQHNADGSLTPLDFELPVDPELHMVGHGLYATVGDYMRFIRMWLNDGNGENGRVLKAETVKMAVMNGLGDKKIKMLPGVIPSLSNDAEFFPGRSNRGPSRSWSTTTRHPRDVPPGRSDGRVWPICSTGSIGRTASAASGATQILPFGDPASFGGYVDFETAFYNSLRKAKAA